MFAGEHAAQTCCFRPSRGSAALGSLFGLHEVYGKTSDMTKPKQWLGQNAAVLCLYAAALNKEEAGNSEQRAARGQSGDVKTAHLTN